MDMFFGYQTTARTIDKTKDVILLDSYDLLLPNNKNRPLKWETTFVVGSLSVSRLDEVVVTR